MVTVYCYMIFTIVYLQVTPLSNKKVVYLSRSSCQYGSISNSIFSSGIHVTVLVELVIVEVTVTK